MPVQVTDVDVLQRYLQGVMEKADHHAAGVNEIALAIAGAIVWRKDDQPIKVLSHGCDMKNVLWVTISGQRYAFAYDHQAGGIDIREGSTHGRVLHTITNATSLTQLRQIFESL